MRIVSFLPSATEILYLLGLGDDLVGVSHECDFPPEARQKPWVIRCRLNGKSFRQNKIHRIVSAELQAGRGIYTIDLELLKRLSPDLFVTQELCSVCAISHSDVLRAASLLCPRPHILSLSPNQLEDVFQDILNVGEATGKKKIAKAQVSSLRKRVLAVSKKLQVSSRRPRVVCLEWLDPLMIAGHWVPEMVRLAGGIDPLGEEGKPSVRMEWKRVAHSKPDILLLMPCGVKITKALRDARLLSRLPGWNDLPAVRKGEVYALDGPSYLNRSGPRLVDGLEMIASLIHPSRFSPDRFRGAFRRVVDCDMEEVFHG
jgi:iron complex transport system substrate-binding protein